MSTDAERSETSGAGAVAVAAVLTPVLSGSAAVSCLLIGYILKTLRPEPAVAGTMLITGWVCGAVTVVAILIAAIALLLTALRDRQSTMEPEATPHAGPRNGRAGLRTLNLASFVAGQRRAHLREE
ncbi:hypothetical protein [Streptomyces sp. NPDC050548]|uniref:hypothetical protein n=1 Tax=Streptomyces sp. NPDC050548 TaxID=3365629 RepID=UPI003790E589